MAKHTHHARLEQLREAEQNERTTARDLEAKARAAAAAADDARQALVQAHVDNTDVKSAEQRRTKAQAEAEDLAIRSEAAELRIKRAERDRKQYESDHGRKLIDELEPEANAVTARLEQAARDLIEADRDWNTVNGKVSALLAAIPSASPRMDSTVGHRLADVAREARKALQGGEIETPLPTWQGMRTHEQAEQAARMARNIDEPSAA